MFEEIGKVTCSIDALNSAIRQMAALHLEVGTTVDHDSNDYVCLADLIQDHCNRIISLAQAEEMR